MKIRMIEHRSGGRYDGRVWPPVGVDFDVPDEEGAGLCAQGSAIPVPSDPKVETREDKRGAESHSAAPQLPGEAKPGRDAPKSAWVAWGARHGEAAADLEKLSKADLMSRYGG